MGDTSFPAGQKRKKAPWGAFIFRYRLTRRAKLSRSLQGHAYKGAGLLALQCDHRPVGSFPAPQPMYGLQPNQNRSGYEPDAVFSRFYCGSGPAYGAPENPTCLNKKRFHDRYLVLVTTLPDHTFYWSQSPYHRYTATFCDRADSATEGLFQHDLSALPTPAWSLLGEQSVPSRLYRTGAYG